MADPKLVLRSSSQLGIPVNLMSEHPSWLDVIRDPKTYPHPVSKIEVLETHISWIVLTGDWTYKLKKPVDLGFVNFSTLELRHAACLEELRLNQRTAPDLYDSVVEMTDDGRQIRFGGKGQIVEYAVRMRQFSQNDLLEQVLRRNELTEERIDQLADEVACLHLKAEVAPEQSPFGKPDLIRETVNACLSVLAKAPLTDDLRAQSLDLQRWVDSEWKHLREIFIARKQMGRVRECHGDLHLGNLVLIEGKPTLFDCLEFNAGLRWIDQISDIGFLVMDLHDRKSSPLAWRVLNQWLERTGDFDGLFVLRFYLTYRALVRAKVAAIRMQQSEISSTDKAHQQELIKSYVALARSMTKRDQPSLLLMHGVSGSGKTHIARELACCLGAIRIRSDVERKRPWTNWPSNTSQVPPTNELYCERSNRTTYQRLQTLTRTIVQSGYSVIVDGAFLKIEDRREFELLAADLGIPFVIVSCRASERILIDRIKERAAHGHDVSDATTDVLRQQLSSTIPLSPTELPFAVEVNTAHDEVSPTVEAIRKTLSRATAMAARI